MSLGQGWPPPESQSRARDQGRGWGWGRGGETLCQMTQVWLYPKDVVFTVARKLLWPTFLTQHICATVRKVIRSEPASCYINRSFICAGEPKKFLVRLALLRYLLPCGVWNRTCRVSEVCLWVTVRLVKLIPKTRPSQGQPDWFGW